MRWLEQAGLRGRQGGGDRLVILAGYKSETGDLCSSGPYLQRRY